MKTKSNSVNFVNIEKVFQIVLYLWKTMSKSFDAVNMDILIMIYIISVKTRSQCSQRSHMEALELLNDLEDQGLSLKAKRDRLLVMPSKKIT